MNTQHPVAIYLRGSLGELIRALSFSRLYFTPLQPTHRFAVQLANRTHTGSASRAPQILGSGFLRHLLTLVASTLFAASVFASPVLINTADDAASATHSEPARSPTNDPAMPVAADTTSADESTDANEGEADDDPDAETADVYEDEPEVPIIESVADTPAEDNPSAEPVTTATEPTAPAEPQAQNAAPDNTQAPEHTATPPTQSPGTEASVPVIESQGEQGAPPQPQQAITILGAEVKPGTAQRLSWGASHTIDGINAPTPVLVIHGANPGPKVCLTAAIHGDELNGIEIVRRVMNSVEADKLSGTLIGVPIVNIQGFHRASRYLADRRDLNRYFPGRPHGSSASRIAYSFFHEVIAHCEALIDLHTGSMHRTNLPQLRADLNNPKILELTENFGGMVVLHQKGARGTLRRAAAESGIPAITLETGGAMQLHEKPVSLGVKGIQTLLYKMGMYRKTSFWGEPEPVYYQSTWVRTNQGGILFSEVKLGQKIRQGQLLGTVTDPITNARQTIMAPMRGRILGMALNQVVQPGFAVYRIGIQTSDDSVPEPEFDDDVDAAPEEAAEAASDVADNEVDEEENLDLFIEVE